MVIKKLVLEKSSVALDYLFESLNIVEENNEIIERSEFVIKMETVMGREGLSRERGQEIRTQFNKTKLPRYYGLLRTMTEKGRTRQDDKQFIVLTKRGQEVLKIIKKTNEDFLITDKEHFKKIILYSILYDTFGKNNDGVEQSKSDVEPPKILLKSILDLGHITKNESIYLIFSLNEEIFNNYEEGINEIKRIRNNPNSEDIIYNRLVRMEKQNFANDNKLIKFFEKLDILYEDDGKYFFTEDILKNYGEIIKSLNPISKNLQLLILGNPGSGKSYYINNIILGNIVETKQVVRTIVYPEYTYSDFIGYIRPLTIDNKINYTFEPGPFTIALEKCFDNPKSNIYLIVEEINRGNIQAIFGDIIQLLDRTEDFKSKNHGFSKYPIENSEIYKYLLKKLGKNKIQYLKENQIVLPQNFNIILTLNNSEENNYFIDSAFKRRFNNLYLRSDNPILNNEYIVKLNTIAKTNIFDEKYNWTEFAQKINNIIDKENKEFYTISEAKKLSPFFVNINDVSDKEQFCDKVIYYLKNDVFKYNERILNTSYDKIRNSFINGKDFFEIMEE